jgi:hypothetical protein
MKNIVLFTLLFLVALVGKSQNSNLDFSSGFKIYNLTSYELTRHSDISIISTNTHYETTDFDWQVLHPSIAFQWKTEKNNFHEIELKDFTLNKNSTLTELVNDTSSNILTSVTSGISTSLISAQYEYIINFNKSKESKFVPSLGFGINPYFTHSNIHPENSTTYPTRNTYFGAKLNVTPRLTYYVTSKFFVDVNIPICISDSYFSINKVDNPSFPENMRTTTTLNFEQLPMFLSGRIGIGFKI